MWEMLKGLVAGCHSFCLFFIFLYIHRFIQSQFIHPSPFAEASLHFFIACMLSGEDLPVVPSREPNSGLPYSKPTRYIILNCFWQVVVKLTIIQHSDRRLFNLILRAIRNLKTPLTPHPCGKKYLVMHPVSYGINGYPPIARDFQSPDFFTLLVSECLLTCCRNIA